MVTSAFPNQSFYGQNYLRVRHEGDIHPNFAGESIARQAFELIRQSGAPILQFLHFEKPMHSHIHSFQRLAPGSSRTVKDKDKQRVTQAWFDAYVAQNSLTEANALFVPIGENEGSWRHCLPKLQESDRIIGTVWDPLFTSFHSQLEGFYQRDIAAALSRQLIRDLFDDGFFGTAMEGKDSAFTSGFTTIPWNPSTDFATAVESGQYLIEDTTGQGLTRAMLEAADEWFTAHGYSVEGRHILIAEKQKTNLRNITPYMNSDFTTTRLIEGNQVPQVEGFKFHTIGSIPGVKNETSQIPMTADGTKRRCVAWHESVVGWCNWEDKPGRVFEEPSPPFVKGIWSGTMNGFTRIEDKGVVEIRVFEN